jgi:ppGpp synthetase/RelA/SpoT-type nucleotidyltranferase
MDLDLKPISSNVNKINVGRIRIYPEITISNLTPIMKDLIIVRIATSFSSIRSNSERNNIILNTEKTDNASKYILSINRMLLFIIMVFLRIL